VLSSPRVSTINNQKAVIKAGDDEYFVTGVSSNTIAGVGVATNNNLDLAPFFSGVALDVTPQLSGDGQIILHIHPTVSDVTQKVLTSPRRASRTRCRSPSARCASRTASSRAKSGQLIVIGGSDAVEPPGGRTTACRCSAIYRWSGKLFRSQQKTDDHTELVILLRPIIVDSDDQ